MTSLKQPDPFAFGGLEVDTRSIQAPFARYFKRGDLVADLGCGRGTFLELLKQRGVSGLGVDLSDEAVEASRAKGFAIEQQDAIDFLGGRDNDLDGVFASHIVEHLPIDRAVTLVPAAHQALKPGGYLIVVTPNPADVTVITETFWLDPSHIRPYPLALVRQWFTAAGFDVVEARTTSGVPLWAYGRRHVFRNMLSKLLLGRHFWTANTVVIGRKR